MSEQRTGKGSEERKSARKGVPNGRVRTSHGPTRGNGARGTERRAGKAGLDGRPSIAFVLEMQA